MVKPEPVTVQALCFADRINRRRILKLYNPRHPERTLLYQTVAEHYETWLNLVSAGQFDGQGDYRTPKPYVRRAFVKYLECGIFAHGSSLNEHVHFHVCVVDGVFEEVQGNVIFHPASGIDVDTVAQVQATLRRRILRAFVGRCLLESVEAKEMLGYAHSGFSVDAGVCIEAHDRAGLERLRKAGSELVYRCGKQHSEPRSEYTRGAKADELHLTPLELIDRIAALIPPPHITPARGPPLWDECDAQAGEGSQIEPDGDLADGPKTSTHATAALSKVFVAPNH